MISSPVKPFTPEWLCLRHHELAGALFPDWAGRFQSIHPFRDFNGRVGRILLVALLHVLGLPPVEIVPAGQEFRQAYFEALNDADQGNYARLTEMWVRRLAEAL